MMAEGHGDEAQSLHDKVAAAEHEANGEEDSPAEEAAESPEVEKSEQEPMSFKDMVKHDMKKSGRITPSKGSVMIAMKSKMSPMMGKKKHG